METARAGASPAPDIAVTVAPFRAWRDSRLIVAEKPTRAAIDRPNEAAQSGDDLGGGEIYQSHLPLYAGTPCSGNHSPAGGPPVCQNTSMGMPPRGYQ